MSDSRSVATLQSLLRADSNEFSTSSTSSRTDLDSTSTTSYARTYTSPRYWGSTITNAFGYGTSSGEGEAETCRDVKGKGKGKARGGIPLWTPDETEEASTRESTGKEGSGEGSPCDGELEQLVDSILWQAGTDPSSSSLSDAARGPLLVLACSRIPDPSTSTCHLRILEQLRIRLETFASTGSYSIVLLANPTPHPPSTPQLVSSYLSLSRTTRKNLRKLWVVGGGWWTRMILTLFNTTLLSLKTSKKQKIVQCANLSELANELGTKAFTEIEFPLEVYVENGKLEKEIKLPQDGQELQPVFGVPLRDLCDLDRKRLPPILEDCLEVLDPQGPSSLGIFRRSPSASNVKILELCYARHHAVSLSTYPDAPYLAASLLKLFLRSLPEPILPKCVREVSKECPLPPPPPANSQESIEFVRERVLPLFEGDGDKKNKKRVEEKYVLERVVRVLSKIEANSRENLMTSSNLVICLAPALVGGIIPGPGDQDREGIIEACRVPGTVEMNGTIRGGGGGGGNSVGGVLKIMIERYEEIFSSSSTVSSGSSAPHLVDSAIDLPIPTSPTRDMTMRRVGEPVQGTLERTDVRGIFSGGTT